MKKNLKSLKVNMVLNLIKQGFSLLFPLITVKYVTKCLGANVYGIYNYCTSIITYFSYFAAFGISSYAIREGSIHRSERKDLDKVCSEIFSINLIFTIISYIFLWIMMIFVKDIRKYYNIIGILSLSIILTTIGAEWMNEVVEDYFFITIRYIILHLISIIFLFIFIHSKEDLIKYCCITVFSTAGVSLLNIFHRKKYVSIRFTLTMRFQKHIKCMFIFFLSSLAGVIYVNSDITLLGVMMTPNDVGIYSFVAKIYNLIKMTLATIIATSVSRITYYYNNDISKYNEYICKIYTILSLLVLPIISGMIALRTDMILLLGHDEFISGNAALAILSIAIYFAIFGAFYGSMILILRGEERIILFGTILSASFNIVLNFLLIPKLGIIAAAITTVIAELLCYSVSFLYCRKNYIEYTQLNKKPLIISGAMSAIIIILKWFIDIIFTENSFNQCFIRISVLIITSGLIYCPVLFFSKNKNIMSIINMIPWIKRKY